MARRFASCEVNSMLVRMNPEKLAPAAIRNEKTPINRAMSNVGDREWAIIFKRSPLVTSSATASKGAENRAHRRLA
jgi:hypothetical protein